MQQPLSPPRIIERPFLRNLLLESLEKSHVLLTAPGGYGKSMALRDLARHHPQAQLVTITQADLDLSVLKTRLTPLLDSSNLIMLDDVHLLTGGGRGMYVAATTVTPTTNPMAPLGAILAI